MSHAEKKTFRDGTYYRHVLAGKRTVKEGECAAIWTPSGDRKLIEGPRRVRLWFSHVRFLDRCVADASQFLSVQYRDGRKEHVRGPVAQFKDPCVHQSMKVCDAYKLAANEALVVYCEKSAVAPGTPACVMPDNGEPGKDPQIRGAAVERRIVMGPAVFIPSANDWIHKFSWHGSPSAKGNGSGSKTGTPGDTKLPHGTEFEKLRCMPDQMYCSVRDVRTSDDAQLTVQLLLFYELRDIERMLDATNDPIGEIVNAASADVMTFGAANTYESFLLNPSSLSETATFPLLASRMEQAGFLLHKVVYRGYTTCEELQAMHNTAVAERTRLRLEAHTVKEQEAQRALELQARQERSRNEQALAAAEAQHELSLLHLKNEAARAEADARHGQELRHARERAAVDAELRRGLNDEELRRAEGLQAMGVDLTKYLVAVESTKPDRHIRVESTAGPPAVHLDLPQHS
mmetsp:Transcript_11605/g.23634  ORF Transcript_11605/g.23634 Transcript_11605/m.23634 type:complete len:460 (-) Transcript_11605:207-1586(-)